MTGRRWEGAEMTGIPPIDITALYVLTHFIISVFFKLDSTRRCLLSGEGHQVFFYVRHNAKER